MDDQKARQYIQFLYKTAHQKYPQVDPDPLVIITDSPVSTSVALNLFSKRKNLRGKGLTGWGDSQGILEALRELILGPTQHQIRDQILCQIQITSDVSKQISEQNGVQRTSQYHARMAIASSTSQILRTENSFFHDINRDWPSIFGNDQLYLSFRQQILTHCWEQIYPQLQNQIPDANMLQEKTQFITETTKYESLDNFSNWNIECDVADLDVYSQLVSINSPEFNTLKALMQPIWASTVSTSACFLSRPPVKWLRDPQNRLHSETEAAIQFRDGQEDYYVHGVAFSKDQFKAFFPKRATIPVSAIMALKNTERRAAVIQCYGWDAIWDAIKKKTILEKKFEYAPGLKRRVPIQLVEFYPSFDKLRRKALVLHDHSSEKRYVERVPDECHSIHDALQWQYWGHDPNDIVYST
jgi:hypothetical protein